MSFSQIRDRLAKIVASRSVWLWVLTSIAALYLFWLAIFAVLNALNRGAYFNDYAADGPFQLYNPLRRLADGQIAGRDFPFFHGIGIPLLHYIPFELLGGNLFASEVTRWLLSPAVFVTTGMLFFYSMLRSWRKSIVATSLLTVIAIIYSDVVFPSNSLLGIRTTFPMLAAAALMWPTTRQVGLRKHKLTIELNYFIAIICIVCAFLCGTEQGIAAALAFLVIRSAGLVRRKRWIPAIRRVASEGGLIAAIILATLTVITLGHPFKPLAYGLISVPQEQSWYFGSPPNYYLSGEYIWPFFTEALMHPTYIIFALSLTAFILARRWKVVTRTHEVAAVFLCLYSLLTLVTFLGYLNPYTQLFPVTRVALTLLIGIAVAIAFDKRLWSRLQPSKHSRKLHFATSAAGIAVLLILMAGYLIRSMSQTIAMANNVQIKSVLQLSRAAYHSPDTKALTPPYKTAVDAFLPEIQPNTKVWPMYSSIYESNAGIIAPAAGGQDYIIHALGEKDREAYGQQFVTSKTDYAITLRPSYFPYEEWLWSKNWPVYRQLVTNYALIKENSMHFLWKYSGKPAVQKPWQTAKKADGRYPLPANGGIQPKLYEVKVDYSVPAGLPILNKLGRYFIESSGSAMHYPVSLPPYEQTWSFPVFIAPGQDQPKLYPSVKGILPGASMSVTKLQYRELEIPTINYKIFTENWNTSR